MDGRTRRPASPCSSTPCCCASWSGTRASPERTRRMLHDYLAELDLARADLGGVREALRGADQPGEPFRFPALVADWGLDYFAAEARHTRRALASLRRTGRADCLGCRGDRSTEPRPARAGRAGPRRHPVGAARRRDRQGPLRRDLPDRDGLAAPGHQRARPRRGRPAAAHRADAASDWLVVLGFGLSLATMNWAIYQSFSRIPLGIAVTIEFIGPLTLAVLGSRHARDLVWVLLAGRRRRAARPRADRPRPARRAVRPARRRRVGGVHPAQREHRAALGRVRRARRGQHRRRRRHDAAGAPDRRRRASGTAGSC